AGLDLLGERGRPARQPDPRLRPTDDLDLLPREADAAAERLADCLLAGEARGVALSGMRTRVAVRALGVGEAALAKPVPCERAADALDLDDVDADLHLRGTSRPSGPPRAWQGTARATRRRCPGSPRRTRAPPGGTSRSGRARSSARRAALRGRPRRRRR